MARKTLPGTPFPQGATWDGTGVNFALYSENATSVEVCLFENPDSQEGETIEVTECTGYVWHCYVPALTMGQLYGYRVHGPFQPEQGLRFNSNKLLIDPYARAIASK
ncbi:MAG: glycogen debranching enzyme GlgX, partial [Acidobacteriaceae bacterium]|nr:glycogen debranching enzyme GlgX [Acidobacteriaceae bacterium]